MTDSKTANLRRFARDGTAVMVTGTLIAGVGNYAYQLLGGRVLGPEQFAAIGSLLTLHFLAFIVVLLPVEQLVIRALTIRGGLTRSTVRTIAITVAITTGTAFAVGLIGQDRLFGGDERFAYIAAATVLSHSLFVYARGSLAGLRRFGRYGRASGGASLLRLAVAVIVVLVAPSGLGFAAALAAGPLVVLAWPSSLKRRSSGETATRPATFLGTFILAAATSQVLLLAGPLAAAFLGAEAAMISTVFVTFTLARAPLTFGYNLIARVLPPFTVLAERGDDVELDRWVGRLFWGGVAAAVPAAIAGWWAGAPIVVALFGEGFRPDPMFAALAAGGVTIAGTSLFLGQVLVARGQTARLTGAWMMGLAAAGLGLLVPTSSIETTIGLAFVLGESAALGGLASLALSGRSSFAYPVLKRLLDLTAGVILLVLVSPALLAVAIAIRLDSKGPVFFKQTRVGLDGQPFGMVKFRSMYTDAGEALHRDHIEALREQPDADRLKMTDDPRITRVGRLLRKGSLDELPNLWNVVKGDMSLVGPRPLVPEESEMLGTPIRRSVKPGVTGLAQIHGRDAISPLERNRLDAEYVEHRSFLLDLRILAKTLPALVRNPGE